MIRIDPSTPPTEYEKLAAEAFAKLRDTYEAGGYKTQRRFEFDERVWRPYATQLAEPTFGKCAYCETSIAGRDQIAVDHYRPRTKAEGLAKGEISPDHYWWLAYEWRNLVPSCTRCVRAKRNRFPVLGRRAEPFSSLDGESPLVLCPYGPLEPDEHLWFEESGHVNPLSDQGEVTIQVLELNRDDLIQGRRRRAVQVLNRLDQQRRALDTVSREELTAPHVEYSAVARQLLERRGLATSNGDDGGSPTPGPKATPTTTKLSRAVAVADLASVWIVEVDLVNITCIDELELRFSEPATGREPWIVLLGSNGVGKSSVLKAIALALCSDEDRSRLMPDPSRFVRHGTDSGRIRVRFNDGREVSVVLRKRSKSFKVTGSRPPFGLVGYGSTRLLRRSPTRAFTNATGPTLSNLFDPWTPLADAETWLADTDRVSSDHFQVLASQVKTLLSIEHDVGLNRLRGRLRARVFGELLDLPQLSDGYQTILALALDLTMAFGGELGQGFSTENFEGMVLLDELEVHLHPEWKMKVVSDLRTIFPHLQFVVTTHDPLCLRGLERGEIHLMRRANDDVITVEQIDVPPGLDADEILTGQWFGLTTTLDPEVETDLLEYQRLRMQGLRPDDQQLAPLRQRLTSTIGSYTGTSAGGVLLDAASELAAEQAAVGPVRLTKDEVKQRLLDHVQRPRP
jgi:hypothetical protein